MAKWRIVWQKNLYRSLANPSWRTPYNWSLFNGNACAEKRNINEMMDQHHWMGSGTRAHKFHLLNTLSIDGCHRPNGGMEPATEMINFKITIYHVWRKANTRDENKLSRKKWSWREMKMSDAAQSENKLTNWPQLGAKKKLYIKKLFARKAGVRKKISRRTRSPVGSAEYRSQMANGRQKCFVRKNAQFVRFVRSRAQRIDKSSCFSMANRGEFIRSNAFFSLSSPGVFVFAPIDNNDCIEWNWTEVKRRRRDIHASLRSFGL